jgi:hypothetical protein
MKNVKMFFDVVDFTDDVERYISEYKYVTKEMAGFGDGNNNERHLQISLVTVNTTTGKIKDIQIIHHNQPSQGSNNNLILGIINLLDYLLFSGLDIANLDIAISDNNFVKLIKSKHPRISHEDRLDFYLLQEYINNLEEYGMKITFSYLPSTKNPASILMSYADKLLEDLNSTLKTNPELENTLSPYIVYYDGNKYKDKIIKYVTIKPTERKFEKKIIHSNNNDIEIGWFEYTKDYPIKLEEIPSEDLKSKVEDDFKKYYNYLKDNNIDIVTDFFNNGELLLKIHKAETFRIGLIDSFFKSLKYLSFTNN